MEYLNAYRKPLDDKPLCPAQKRNLLTFVKKFYVKNLLAKDELESIELPSKGRQLPKAIFSPKEVENIIGHNGFQH